LAVFAFAATRKEEEAPIIEPKRMAVETSLPVYEEITEWDEYTRRFEASDRVEVRARISGLLTEVRFTDGQYIKKGQVLFVIDQRPFKIQLDEAEASYAEVKAGLKATRDEFERAESLRESGAMSAEEYDRRNQAVARSEASLQLAQAKV